MKNQFNFKPTKIFLEIKNITANNIEQTYISLKSVIPKEIFDKIDQIQMELLEDFFSKIESIKNQKVLEDTDLETILIDYNKKDKSLKLPLLVWFNFADQIIVDIIWKEADYLVQQGKLILNPDWRKKVRKEITNTNEMMEIINSSINKIANQLKLQPIQFVGNVTPSTTTTTIVESNCNELKESLKNAINDSEKLIKQLQESIKDINTLSKEDLKSDYIGAVQFISGIIQSLKDII